MRLEVAGHAGGTISASFSPAGGLLATSGNDGMVRIWSVATGELLTSLDGQSSWMPRVAFSADGRTLAAAGGDNHIRVWDLDKIGAIPIARAVIGNPIRKREPGLTGPVAVVIRGGGRASPMNGDRPMTADDGRPSRSLTTPLTHRRLPAMAAVLAIVLTLPALGAGWLMDDYYHRVVLLGVPPFRDLLGPPGEMFHFFRGDPARTCARWTSASSLGGPTR